MRLARAWFVLLVLCSVRVIVDAPIRFVELVAILAASGIVGELVAHTFRARRRARELREHPPTGGNDWPGICGATHDAGGGALALRCTASEGHKGPHEAPPFEWARDTGCGPACILYQGHPGPCVPHVGAPVTK